MEVRFLITGNQEDPKGNPMPKIKLTSGQSWTPKAQKYVAWKGYVQSKFVLALKQLDLKAYNEAERRIIQGHKPIETAKKSRMEILISRTRHANPDPENVFGSIADALFQNDVNLAGAFDYIEDFGKPPFVSVAIFYD